MADIKGHSKLKKRITKLSENTFKLNPIYFLLSCVILPLLLAITSFFMILKQIVNIILKLKYGKLYGGILQSSDSVWAIDDISKSMVNVIVLISAKPNSTQDMTEQMKETIHNKILKNPDDFPKFSSKRLKSMGYNFLLKNQLTVDDCVFTLNIDADDATDETLLQRIASEYSNQPLPKENSSLWEVLVYPRPIKWKSNKKQINAFPILFRYNHILGDGAALTDLLLRTIAVESQECQQRLQLYKIKEKHQSVRDLEQKNMLLNLLGIVKNSLYSLYVILISPMIIMQQTHLRKEDVNALHGPDLSGEKLLVWAVEDEQKLLSVVKAIKRAVPDSRFSDVLLTAISGSLDRHFRYNSQFVPEFATTAVLALLSLPNIEKKPILQNKFSIGLVNLPILTTSTSLLNRLQEVIKETNRLRNSPDYLVNYWLLDMFCGCIPTAVLQQAIHIDKFTMTFSSLPGLPKLSILDGCIVEDIMFFPPHRGTTGVGFSSLTYDNRFQLGLSIDKSILSSKEQVQEIIDDVFKHINLLYDEVCRLYPQNGNGV